MDDEHERKLNAGREKLAAYKKKKQNKQRQSAGSNSGSSSQRDESLSLSSSLLLPDNAVKDHTPRSDSSIISEHIDSNSDGTENDRSLQEIEISSLPLFLDDETPHIVDVRPTINVENNMHSILNEILESEQFKSDSLRAEQSLDSNENSFNLFKDINLNDSLINDYSLKIDQIDGLSEKSENTLKAKEIDDVKSTKELTAPVLTAELESLKEITLSNQSTPSLNTSTDYKLYHDDFQNRIVEYQNALAHRDSVIQKLTEALQQSVINREQLQEQSDHFSKQIVALQKQLGETSALISQQKSNPDSPKSQPRSLIQTSFDLNQHNENSSTQDTELVQSFSAQESVLNWELHCSKLEETLNSPQIDILKELKKCIDLYVRQKDIETRSAHQNEIKIFKDQLENEKIDHNNELVKLRELLANLQSDSLEINSLREELEAKHAKEVEELRTYFEKKCADLEKHYSEEVFSQQSRRMSGSSCCSEASDFLFSNSQPHVGPGGDSGQIYVDLSKIETAKRDFDGVTKHELIKLHKDLSNLMKDLNKYNLENVSKDDLCIIRETLSKYDLRSLLKYDLSTIKNEMQNKYHAELEILREDYENRIDALNVEHEHRLQSLEKRFTDKIETMKDDLEVNVSTAVQEVASSGEFELAEVVQSYERRLQEQVTLAKIDIINALEHQIQMLVANTVEDAEWPAELLQIRNRFTEKYEKEIGELKSNHQDEISKLKDEHLKNLNSALERARRRSLKEGDTEIIKEWESLKKTNNLLRCLIGELMKYFGECEEELNNTLVEELLKQGFDNNSELNESSNSTSSTTLSNSIKKRVHFKPNFDEFLSTINSGPSSLDSNISIDLKNELGACLTRLKSEANEILTISTNFNKTIDEPEKSLQERVATLTKQLITENKIKTELVQELDEAKRFIHNLDEERGNLDTQIEQLVEKQKVLETDLLRARGKIAELIESGHKEIISEGYGEKPKTDGQSLGKKPSTLVELQERARSLVTECGSNTDPALIQLLEDLCREGDRITEEAKSDREDLQQQEVESELRIEQRAYKEQIEAAGKKLRATCDFLEEQAAEREQERDDAQKEIASLLEQLKEREKDRVSYERINREVEHLEHQMRDMSKLMEENEMKYNEVESEKKEAIEKIFVLRDIIRDLESQIETKTETEAALRSLIAQLEDIIGQQTKANDELVQHLASLRGTSQTQQFQKHIESLEDEVQRLRLTTEFAGSEGALKQIKTQLNEFEANIDKRTKELEALHSAISTTSCSSPSEDMSIRDQIRPKTPSALEECDLPLQQLARLKEKLVKHSRVEDAAVKRIHDLEMELVGSRHDLDEIQNERDLLQDQVSEQLVLISSLQMRLDDQRLRAEHVQKQTNTSLELKIYDLDNDIKSLMETIAARDKTIKNLNKIVEETKRRVEDQNKELAEREENKVITDLESEIQKLHSENAALVAKINADAHNAQMLPNLVDNIIADKNKDIERLQEKLDKTQLELSNYLALNIDLDQLRTLSQLQSSERAFSDILSLITHETPEKLRREAISSDSLQSSLINTPNYKRNANETILVGSMGRFEPELSSIEKITSHMNYTSETPLSKPNSTEIHKSEKKVHFEDLTVSKLQNELLQLKRNLQIRDETIKEYTERLTILSDLERSIQQMQEKINCTELALQKATETFEKEQSQLKDTEKNLRVDLAEKKMHLIEKEKQLDLAKEDSNRRELMYVNLSKEKMHLERRLKEILEENDRYKTFDDVITVNNNEIATLKTQIDELTRSMHKIHSLEEQLRNLNEFSNDQKVSIANLKEELEVKSAANSKLEKDLVNSKSHLQLLTQELNNLKSSDLKALLIDRDTEIEILNEDAQRYQDDISTLENNIKSLRNSLEQEFELKLAQSVRDLAAKDLQIVKLGTELEDTQRELQHLKELLEEKDKVVQQMSIDSKSLRLNLETIQDKIQENGNVIDLKRRLESEQELNSNLQEELNILKSKKPVDMTTSIDEITGEVQKQLDYSDHLDSSILSALGDDSQLLNEKKEKLKLEEEIKDLQVKSQNLQHLLDIEKLNSNKIQLEDASMLERLRLRLEAALENEDEFEKIIEKERKTREELEVQIAFLKEKLSNKGSSDNSKTELTEYKSLPNLDSLELIKLKSELHSLQENNALLKSNMKIIKRSKTEVEAALQFSQDMLQLKSDELSKFEKQINDIKLAEGSAKDKLIAYKNELGIKIREVENSRVLLGEIEDENKVMKAEINRLNELLKNPSSSMQQPIPDKVLNKMKELSSLLKENNKENKRMTETIEKLTNERLFLQDKVRELEEINQIKAPYDDPYARANYLFARYLKSESYRKALIWQKRYLTALLSSYQAYVEVPLPVQCILTNKHKKSSGMKRFKIVAIGVTVLIRMQFLVQRWHSGKRGITQIHRAAPSHVQFHVGQPVSSQNFPLQQNTTPPSNLRFNTFEVTNNATNAHKISSKVVGSSSSNRIIEDRSVTPTSPVDLGPWSGNTPPLRDRYTHRVPLVQNDYAPLQTPALLSHYFERFNNIQEQLGMSLENNSS